ncbi:Phospholipase A1 precursor Outer membrane phospholipase A [Candidatus Burkholderia brachyanthoides]|nr:Phospholipase A1 precursor Outer membrane phospholipase A [Candidatus Burkholderia brachyanthoides]
MAHRLRLHTFPCHRATLRPLALLLLTLGATTGAHATVAVLQPAREAAASQPLEITLLYTDDDKKPLNADVPKQLTVNLTNGDLRLAPRQYRRVKFSAPWPNSARGTIKIDPVGFDASPMLVMLNRRDNQTQVVAAEHREAQAMAAANTTAVPTIPQDTMLSGRFSSFEPSYFADGKNGDQIAKFQFSFKYRLHLPDDPRSRGFLDNLYFGYTQTAIWNLSADSVPFRDISFQPQLLYYVENTGVKSPLFTRMGVAAGIGHESNGKAGDESRAINIVFVRPTWEFGDLNANHLTLSPKFYYYLSKSRNQDIVDYRGYTDFLVKYGSPDGWQLATTLRKGTKHWYGSVDANLTYPLAKLVGSAWGGYLFVSYFNGYGEDILDYNQRHHWIARIGYSITR